MENLRISCEKYIFFCTFKYKKVSVTSESLELNVFLGVDSQIYYLKFRNFGDSMRYKNCFPGLHSYV